MRCVAGSDLVLLCAAPGLSSCSPAGISGIEAPCVIEAKPERIDEQESNRPVQGDYVTAQMKIAFAITSAGSDLFSAMTRLAIASVRITNATPHITVVCDPVSDGAMRRAKDPLLDEADEWLVAESPHGSATFRNRFIKTRLREVLEGPFLFLDSDILVRCDLSELFAITDDFAAARNHSCADRQGQVGQQDVQVLDALGWRTRTDLYVNGGVLFYADTAAARTLSAEWHRLWHISHSQCGGYRDQPALNAALARTEVAFSILSDRFNAQFWANPSVAGNACIWHFYSSATDRRATPFETLVAKLRDGQPLWDSDVAALVNSEFPWNIRGFLDRVAAKRLTRRRVFHGWEAAWLNGTLRGYLYDKAVRKLQGAFPA
jgi:hypothetical protein